jgi:hypothetical protein
MEKKSSNGQGWLLLLKVDQLMLIFLRFGLKGRGNERKIKLGPDVRVTLSPNLAHILQIDSYEIDNKDSEERLIIDLAPKAPTELKIPALWQYNIYVVCDGVEESFANNTILRTLGAFHLDDDAQYGDYVTIKFDKPIYRKWVGETNLEEIEIKLVDEIGDELIQRRGHKWAALHIRKTNTSI